MPTAGPDPRTREAFLDATVADELRTRWEDVETAFVDRPHDAVAQGDRLVGEALDELGRVLRERRAELSGQGDDDGAPTEELRQVLRGYRAFLDRLLDL